MIKNEFEDVEGAVAKATRKLNSRFVVQSLDYTAVIFTFRPEVVEQKILMATQHFGDLAHGFETRAQGTSCPCLEVGRRPGGTAVLPELAEALLEFPGARGGTQGAQDGLEFRTRLAAHAGAALEQEEARTLHLGFGLLVAQSGLLAAAHGINRQVEVFGNVEGIQHVERPAGLLCNDLQIGFPHVRADHTQAGEEAVALVFQKREALLQRGLLALVADPEQAAHAGVNLVDEGHEVLALFPPAPVEFINAKGRDACEYTVFQSPLHHPFHRTAHRLPTGLKHRGGLFPGKPPRPAGEEEHVGNGVGTLAATPGHRFHCRPARRTNHPARRVTQDDGDAPERHEMPLPFLHVVVDPTGFAATGTAPLEARIGSKNRLNAGLALVIVGEAHGLDDKTGKVLHAAQECFKLEVDGGCGVVLDVRNTNQAPWPPSASLKGFGHKTHNVLFAAPAVPVKRAVDINPGRNAAYPRDTNFMPSARLTGARMSLDGDPTNTPSHTQNQPKLCGRAKIIS